MAYKFGMMLSLMFLVFSFLIGGDIMCISSIRSSLDNLSLTVAYRLSRDGYLSDQVMRVISSANCYLGYITDESPAYGDTVIYTLCRDFDPLIIADDTMVITVKGTAVVGYIV